MPSASHIFRAMAITGPTASGKTALSLAVAKHFGAEILSCDSMQIYRGMNIGTAKATPEEQALVPHHLIDIADPGESFSASRYKEEAMRKAAELSARGKAILFVGGTGLYLDTLCAYELPEIPASNEEHIRAISERFTRDGELDRDALWAHLYEIDPESAEKTHKNNVRRVLRAIEIYEVSGVAKSELDRRSRERHGPFDITEITLDAHNRDLLYERIDTRVDRMLSDGLLDEARRLLDDGLFCADSTAAQAIGYKEMLDYLNGCTSLDESLENLKRSSRRYAKRQLTWFRSHKNAYVLYIDNEDGTPRDTNDIIAEAVDFFENNYLQKG